MLRDNFRALLGHDVEKLVYKHVYDTIKQKNINELNWNNRNFVNYYIAECVRVHANGITRPEALVGFRDIDLSSAHVGLVKNVTDYKKNYDKDLLCRNCKTATISIERKFTRSLDEGVVRSFTCDTCGFGWSEN